MDSLRDFWAIVVEVWEKGLYDIDIGRIVVAVLIFFAFLLIRPLFSRIVINRVKSYTQKMETPLDDEVLGVVEKPLGFIPIVLGAFFAINHLSLTGQAQLVADRLMRSLIVFVIFWNIMKLVEPLSYFLRKLERVLTVTSVLSTLPPQNN